MGTMKIAHLAEAFGLDVEIHAPGPAHRHCMPAIDPQLELLHARPRQPEDPQPGSSGSGLDVTYDGTYIERRAIPVQRFM